MKCLILFLTIAAQAFAQTCLDGYWLDGNNCEQCKRKKEKGVATWACTNGTNQVAATCYAGYWLDESACSTCATSGNGANAATITCTTGTNQVATTCNAGYWLDESACDACDACYTSSACVPCAKLPQICTRNFQTCGLRKVVKDWIAGGDDRSTVVAKYGPIEDWDVSEVISMIAIFSGETTFNADLSKWNTGAVLSMRSVFSGAAAFNADLSKWDTQALNKDLSGNTGWMMLDMFKDSGFTRTMCGEQWSQFFSSPSGTHGRYGCCDAGTYMASPELNPFVKADACKACPSGQYGSTVEDDITSCNNCGTSGNGANAATITCTTGTNQVATTCNAGYGLVDGACDACDAFTYAVQGNSAACQTCASGSYTDTGTGTTGTTCTSCVTPNNAATVTCTSDTNQVVVTCDAGYTLVGSACNANPTCDNFASCVNGKNHLKNNLNITCATGTCTASDCCDDDSGYILFSPTDDNAGSGWYTCADVQTKYNSATCVC